MEFPFIAEAYAVTKAGDALQKSVVVNNQVELDAFQRQYMGNKIVTKELPLNYIPDESRQSIIRLIKERVEKQDSVSVMRTIKEVMGAEFAVYAPAIEAVSASIIKSNNYQRTKNRNDYFISLNLDRRDSRWQAFNNIGSPLIALLALVFSISTYFKPPNADKSEEKPTEQLQRKVQLLDSILRIQQSQINYLVKALAQKENAKSDSAK